MSVGFCTFADFCAQIPAPAPSVVCTAVAAHVVTTRHVKEERSERSLGDQALVTAMAGSHVAVCY